MSPEKRKLEQNNGDNGVPQKKITAKQHRAHARLTGFSDELGEPSQSRAADTSRAGDQNSFEHRLLQRQLNDMKLQTLLDIEAQSYRLDGGVMREINVLIDYVKSRGTHSPSQHTNDRCIEALKSVKVATQKLQTTRDPSQPDLMHPLQPVFKHPLLQALGGELSRIEANMREEPIRAQAEHQRRLAEVQGEYNWL